MYEFSSTGQLVTLGLVDSSIGTMAKGLALVDVEVSITKDVLLRLNCAVDVSFLLTTSYMCSCQNFREGQCY